MAKGPGAPGVRQFRECAVRTADSDPQVARSIP